MEPSCPLGTTRYIPQAQFHQKPYNKCFIDQVCSVKMAGYWPRSFFCVFMDLDSVSVHKHAKKELGQYPAISTSHLVNNPYFLSGLKLGFFVLFPIAIIRPIHVNIAPLDSEKVAFPYSDYYGAKESNVLDTLSIVINGMVVSFGESFLPGKIPTYSLSGGGGGGEVDNLVDWME